MITKLSCCEKSKCQKNLFWDTTFSGNSTASLLYCLSEKKVPVFSEKFDIFVSENSLKIRFYLNSMTILIFSKNRQIYNTPAASTWFHFDIKNMRGKEMKTEYSRNHVCIIFPKLSYLYSIERNIVIPKWTRKLFRPQVCLNVIRFYIMTKTCSDFGFF